MPTYIPPIVLIGQMVYTLNFYVSSAILVLKAFVLDKTIEVPQCFTRSSDILSYFRL